MVPRAQTKEMVRIVELLCLLADGEHYNLYAEEDDKTVLELALECIDEMGHEGLLDAACLAWLITEVQKQVSICLVVSQGVSQDRKTGCPIFFFKVQNYVVSTFQ